MTGRRTKPKVALDSEMLDESDESKEKPLKHESAAENKPNPKISNTTTDPSDEVVPPSSSTGDEGEYDQEVTRCVCGNQELDPALAQRRGVNSSLFIQCEECHAWQHGYCVGFSTVRDVPELYFCEQCRPEYHDIGDGYSRYFGVSRRRKRAEDTSPEGRDKRSKPEVKSEESPKKRSARSTGVKDPKEGELEVVPSTVANSENAENVDSTAESEQSTKKSENGRGRRVTAASREDAILRRVLEQSAQEARAMAAKAAAAEKRALERKVAEQETEHETPAEQETEVEGGETDGDTRRRSRRDQRPSESLTESGAGATDSGTVVKTDSDSNDTNTSATKPRGKRTRRFDEKPASNTTPTRTKGKRADARKPRRGGGAAGGRNSTRQAANQPMGSGLKRCKPRIPAPRASIPEMRKRVSAVLEFSGHMQGEMLSEEHNRAKMLSSQLLKESGGSAVAQLEGLCSRHTQSLAMLEELTRKLLSWQEQYG